MRSEPTAKIERMGFVVAILIVLAWIAPVPAIALDEVWIVRHAEKLDPWWPDRDLDAYHPLSVAGAERAERLADLLAEEDIVVVLTSETTRSVHTAWATAIAHEVPVRAESVTLDRADIPRWRDALLEEFPGEGAALIVGHSNTVPWLLESFGATPDCHEVLGITEEPHGLSIEGHEGLWRVRLDGHGCDSIERQTIE